MQINNFQLNSLPLVHVCTSRQHKRQVPFECMTKKEKQLRIAKYYKAIIVHNLSYKLCSLREQNKNIKGYVE